MLYFVSEAFISIKRSWMMMFVSIVTITISLIVFGVYLVVYANIHNIAELVSSKMEISVYLKEGLTKREISDLVEEWQALPSVKSANFVDKKSAWKKFQQNFKTIDLADIQNKNPLPHAIRVHVKESKSIKPLSVQFLGKKKYVDDVRYSGKIAERIEVFSRFTRYTGIVLVGLLTIATLFIIINTIRLTVMARHTEIEIMQLVGATDTFIRWPFIIEGLIIGVIGATFAVGFLKSSYVFVGLRFQEHIPFFPVLFDGAVLNKIFVGVGIFGPFLGIVGAYLSISKSLKHVM